MVNNDFWSAKPLQPALPAAVITDGAPRDVADLVAPELNRKRSPAEFMMPDRAAQKRWAVKSAFAVYSMNGFTIAQSEFGFGISPPAGMSDEQIRDVHVRAQWAMTSGF